MVMKVRCIYHFRRERAHWPETKFPAFGATYTVIDRLCEDFGQWFILAELENTCCWHGGWWSKRFRPLVEAQTTQSTYAKEPV